MITRKQSPVNLGMPFAPLDGFITPNERFYVQNHFTISPLNANSWRLKIEGAKCLQ